MTAPEEFNEEYAAEDTGVEIVDEGAGYEESYESTSVAPIVIDRPVQTVGRRKEAVVRVRLQPGTGQFVLNGRPIEDYFKSATHRMIIEEPLRITQTSGRYDIIAKIEGGGVSGQAGALRHAISKSLIELDPDHAQARERTLQRYAVVKEQAGASARAPRKK